MSQDLCASVAIVARCRELLAGAQRNRGSGWCQRDRQQRWVHGKKSQAAYLAFDSLDGSCARRRRRCQALSTHNIADRRDGRRRGTPGDGLSEIVGAPAAERTSRRSRSR